MKDLKTSLQYTQKEVDELKTMCGEQKTEISSLKKDLKGLSVVKEENRKLQKQVLALEAYTRRENLVLENVQETENEVCANVVQGVFRKLGIERNICLQRAHRLGRKTQGNKKDAEIKFRARPIIIRFAFFPDREEVWHLRTKLKGSNIIIREDFPEQIETERRTLLPIFHAARLNKDMNTKLVGNKLVINQQTFTVESLNKLPSPVALRAVSERVVKTDKGFDLHLFQGRLSPFSNMYPATFQIDGKTFNSVEQCYTYGKAIYAQQPEVAEEVLGEYEPTKVKHLGKQLFVNQNMWLGDKGTQLMEDALYAKFNQNPALRTILAETHRRTLVECNRFDSTWGIGVGLFNKEAEDLTTWKCMYLLRKH